MKRTISARQMGQFALGEKPQDMLITNYYRKRDGKPRMIGGQFVVVRVGVQQLSVSPNTSHPMLQICSKLLHGNSNLAHIMESAISSRSM